MLSFVHDVDIFLATLERIFKNQLRRICQSDLSRFNLFIGYAQGGIRSVYVISALHTKFHMYLNDRKKNFRYETNDPCH